MIDGGEVCNRCGSWYHSGRHTTIDCLIHTEKKVKILNERYKESEKLIEDYKDKLSEQQDYMKNTVQVLTLRHFYLGKEVDKNSEEMQKIRDICDYLETIDISNIKG